MSIRTFGGKRPDGPRYLSSFDAGVFSFDDDYFNPSPAPAPPSPAEPDGSLSALQRVREKIHRLAKTSGEAWSPAQERVPPRKSLTGMADLGLGSPAGSEEKVRFWGADELADVEKNAGGRAGGAPASPLAGVTAAQTNARDDARPEPKPAAPILVAGADGGAPPLRPASRMGGAPAEGLAGGLSTVGALASPSVLLRQRRSIDFQQPRPALGQRVGALGAELGALGLGGRSSAGPSPGALSALAPAAQAAPAPRDAPREHGATAARAAPPAGCTAEGSHPSRAAAHEQRAHGESPPLERARPPVGGASAHAQGEAARGSAPARAPPRPGAEAEPAQPTLTLEERLRRLRLLAAAGSGAEPTERPRREPAAHPAAPASPSPAPSAALRGGAIARAPGPAQPRALSSSPLVAPAASPLQGSPSSPWVPAEIAISPARAAARAQPRAHGAAAVALAAACAAAPPPPSPSAGAGAAAAAPQRTGGAPPSPPSPCARADGADAEARARASPSSASAREARAAGSAPDAAPAALAVPPCGMPEAALYLVLCHVDAADLAYPAAAVCARWRNAARTLLSLGTLVGCSEAHEVVLAEPASLYAAFPTAELLAEGGCKRVYRATTASGGSDALAIVDVRRTDALGARQQLELEVAVMHFCGLLVAEGVCPHYVQLHGTFLLGFELPHAGWSRPEAALPPSAGAGAASPGGASDASDEQAAAGGARAGGRKQPRPRRRAAAAARADEPSPPAAPLSHVLQGVHMELCEGGDLEALTAGTTLPLEDVRALCAQMLLSVRCVQLALCLRHHDLKLLNFFARPPRGVGAEAARAGARVEYTYVLPAADGAGADAGAEAGAGADAAGGGCGRGARADAAPTVLRLQLDACRPTLCLLSDFGTAEVGDGTLGAPICAHHLTTYENAPPEYLLLGARAAQQPSADAWALGLAVLHLATGHAPYEELLAGLRCPPALRDALHAAWAGGGRAYAPVRKALAADDDDALVDTLYRYTCMLGGVPGVADAPWLAGSAAHAALVAWASEHAEALGADVREYSLETGGPFATARERFAALPGLEELTRALLALDPADRWSVDAALRSAALFEPLRVREGSPTGGGKCRAPWSAGPGADGSSSPGATPSSSSSSASSSAASARGTASTSTGWSPPGSATAAAAAAIVQRQTFYIDGRAGLAASAVM